MCYILESNVIHFQSVQNNNNIQFERWKQNPCNLSPVSIKSSTACMRSSSQGTLVFETQYKSTGSSKSPKCKEDYTFQAISGVETFILHGLNKDEAVLVYTTLVCCHDDNMGSGGTSQWHKQQNSSEHWQSQYREGQHWEHSYTCRLRIHSSRYQSIRGYLSRGNILWMLKLRILQ